MWALRVGVVGLLLLLCYQDWRSRSVQVWIFPVLTGLLLALKVIPNYFFSLTDAIFNIALLAFQLLLVSLYFSAKQKRWVNLTKNFLGWGDILLLVCLSFYLSPVNYLAFYVISLLSVMIFWAMRSVVISKSKETQIPLAGLQALLFAVVFTLEGNVPSLHLRDDTWLLDKLILWA